MHVIWYFVMMLERGITSLMRSKITYTRAIPINLQLLVETQLQPKMHADANL